MSLFAWPEPDTSAPAAAIAGADLVVAGARVHALLGLPSGKTREQARTGGLAPGAAPGLSHPPMRAWLKSLPQGHGRPAAIE